MATPAQMTATWQKRRAALKPALRKVAANLAVTAIKHTKETMTREIYAIPEDRTAKGERRFLKFLTTRKTGQVFRPGKGDRKWRRTGNLRRREEFEVSNDGLTVTIVNRASYGLPRHEAGKPGHRKINPLRESHWRDDLKEVFQPTVVEEWRETILDILRGKA